MNYYLIDDDLLIRKSWEFAAKKADVKFQSFESVDDFIKASKTFMPESLIYIDQDLGDGALGVEQAKKISDLGFHNIFLATGHDPDTIEKPTYIVKITGKKPPF